MDPGEGAATKPQRKALRKKANLVFIESYGLHLLLPLLDGQLRDRAGSKVRTKASHWGDVPPQMEIHSKCQHNVPPEEMEPPHPTKWFYTAEGAGKHFKSPK